MTLCPSCGRRPSERIGVDRDSRGSGLLYMRPSAPCADPIHDAADRALDAEALLEEAADMIDELRRSMDGRGVVDEGEIKALLQRLRARKQGEQQRA